MIEHVLCRCCGQGPLEHGERYPVLYQSEDSTYCRECATMVLELGGTQDWAKKAKR